jgi:hypothetical protein
MVWYKDISDQNANINKKGSQIWRHFDVIANVISPLHVTYVTSYLESFFFYLLVGVLIKNNFNTINYDPQLSKIY